jgi:hypothetical protein
MLNLLAGAVAFLLVAPFVVVPAVGLLFLAAALAGHDSRRVRTRFACPWTGRVVTADFLVEPAAAYPAEVLSCTAFRDPARVTCHKACRGLAEVRWTPPRGLFPAWALTAGGPVGWEAATPRGR